MFHEKKKAKQNKTQPNKHKQQQKNPKTTVKILLLHPCDSRNYFPNTLSSINYVTSSVHSCGTSGQSGPMAERHFVGNETAYHQGIS